MKEKRKLLMFGIISLVLILSLIGGLTYAFFTANVEGNDDAKATEIVTATLKLKLADTAVMDMNNAYPGRTETKVFTVENIGDASSSYDIILTNVVSSFIGSDLVYTITSNNNGGTREETVLPNTDETIIENVVIEPGVIQTYTFTITFKETGGDQNNNQGAGYSGLIQISPRISSGTVVGYVRDAGGNVMPNTLVQMHSSPRETKTNESGYYEFRNVEAGVHTISVLDDEKEVLASKEVTMLVGTETIKQKDNIIIIATAPKKYVNIQVAANQGLDINVETAKLMLSEINGNLYVGGNPKDIVVSGEGYGVLSCTSSDASVTCSITNNILTITPVSTGSGIVTLKEDKTNTEVTYTYEVKSTDLLLSKTSGLLYIDGNDDEIEITGTNLGEVTCGTTNNNVAVCSVSNGKLNVRPVGAGSAVITVRENNGNQTKTYEVEVRGVTLNLNVTSGVGYVGGADITSNITALEVGTLSCESSDTSKATCSINNNILYITPVAEGNAIITVRESNANKSAVYTATIKDTLVECTINPSVIYYGIEGTSADIIGSGTNNGNLTYKIKSGSEYATLSEAKLTATSNATALGNTVVVEINESNGNKTNTCSLTVKKSSISLSSTSGVGYVGGSNLTSTITNTNGGELTCESTDSTKAICNISGSTLIITPIASGTPTIIVRESNANKTASFEATIKEVSIILSSTSGDLFLGGTNKMITINGSNYNNLSCESSDTSKATCSISGTTLIIIPLAAGTTTITVNESNINKTAAYIATVKATTINLSETSGTMTTGSTKNITIAGTNMGTLSCESNNTSKATCSIDGTTLTINGIAEGSATITVSEGNGNKSATYSATITAPYPTIKEKIISVETAKSDASLTFATSSATQGQKGLYYTANASTYGEDGTKIYYYRGAVTNNWVSFGGYYWRIVRTTAEGGVKLIYSGESTTLNYSGFIGKAIYNVPTTSLYHSGYTYNTSGYSGTQTSSTTKTVVDAWYSGSNTTGGECNAGNNCNFALLADPLINYSSYLSNTAVFCHDRSSKKLSGTYTYYPSYSRIWDSNRPTFKCPSTNESRYTVTRNTSNGNNGYLTYPIALITVDEVIYAGLAANGSSTTPESYIMDNASWTYWWTMTPAIWRSDAQLLTMWYVTRITGYGYTDNEGTTSNRGVRPVVALKSCVTVTGGTGTSSDPYTLSASNC